ncbi:hypothetical protein ACQK5W_02230 [Pantoea sp. FN060301]|uniref:hypothetical protein n=1 Tax=Pantoea sp. FN060301 TaxID=3420380 RepID=UPI003D181F71
MKNGASSFPQAGFAVSPVETRFSRPARRELTFLFGKLTDIVPTNADCYLTACNGTLRIIDRYRPPVAGCQVLIERAGRNDWASVSANPERLVTGDGVILQGEQLREVTVIGVAIGEVVPARSAVAPVPLAAH